MAFKDRFIKALNEFSRKVEASPFWQNPTTQRAAAALDAPGQTAQKVSAGMFENVSRAGEGLVRTLLPKQAERAIESKLGVQQGTPIGEQFTQRYAPETYEGSQTARKVGRFAGGIVSEGAPLLIGTGIGRAVGKIPAVAKLAQGGRIARGAAAIAREVPGALATGGLVGAKEGAPFKDIAKTAGKYAAYAGLLTPASFIPNVGKIPVVRSLPRIGAAAAAGAGAAKLTGDDPRVGATVGALVGAVGEPAAPQQPKGYVQEQVAKQEAARTGQSTPGDLVKDIRKKMVDSQTAIEDVLAKEQRKRGYVLLPSADYSDKVDRVLRSSSLAGQFIKDNGLAKVIREVDDTDAFNQYLIARQAQDVAKRGIQTGRDLKADQVFLAGNAAKYEPYAKEVTAYSQKTLDYLADAGVLSRDLVKTLKERYPAYAPLNRIFSAIEQETMRTGGKPSGIASVSSQGVLKALKGSERAIENPLESLVTKTVEAVSVSERNRAAQTLTGYASLPGNPFGLKQVAQASPGKGTISVLRDGVKEVWEANPEVVAAAKNLNQQQFGLLGQILSVPTRTLKAGATGLNVPFIAGNVARDQLFSFITSKYPLSTNNPVTFGRALFSVLREDELYDDWIRSGASFSSFDIARNQPGLTVDRIRAGASLPSKIGFTVKTPREFLRAVEDIMSKSEELTRVQQFSGTRDALVGQGRTLQDATILAAKASRENTANFARRGEWGSVLNVAIPYLNAGIQGARSLMRAIQNNPVQTSAKLATAVFLPIATATVWNLKDEKRKAAYDDIPEFEKDRALIIVPPDPVYDEEKKRWNVIRIPITPGLSNLGAIVRRQVEGVHDFADPQTWGKIASDFFAAGTSFNLEPNELVSQTVPQLLKPAVESYTNTNLFTGRQIVPEELKDAPPEFQVKPYTSGTARLIGGLTKASPLKVENNIKTMTSGVGEQALNASDRALAALGIIPKEQIGGRSISEQIEGRIGFPGTAVGGAKENQDFKAIDQLQGKRQQIRYEARQDAASALKQVRAMSKDEAATFLATLKQEDPTVFQALKDAAEDEKLGVTSVDRAVKSLGVQDGTRAQFIAQKLAQLPSIEAQRQYLVDLKNKKILTADVAKQVAALRKGGM